MHRLPATRRASRARKRKWRPSVPSVPASGTRFERVEILNPKELLRLTGGERMGEAVELNPK
jgi:hypothetical protein